MSKGKRLANKKHPSNRQQRITRDTGKLRLRDLDQDNDNDYDDNRISVAVEDFADTTISLNIFTNNAGHFYPNENHVSNTDGTPQDSPFFNWWQFIAVFLIISIAGALLYERIAPLFIYLGTVSPAIITIFPFETWLPPKFSHMARNFRRSLRAGAVLSLLFLAFFCGYLGFRLDIRSKEVQSIFISTAEITPFPSTSGTEVSSPLPIGIEDSGNIIDPIIVTPHPEGEDSSPMFIQSDFFTLIQYDSNGQDRIAFAASDMDFWRATFLNKMKQSVANQRPLVVSSEIYKEFAQKADDANNLYAQLSQQPDYVASIEEIIQLREAAYKLNPTASVCSLLADDYHTLALEYKKIGDLEKSYSNYYKAAKWELTYIQFLNQTDDNFYSAVYFIATIYHGIGVLEHLSDSEKIDAHYISACLFGATSQNSFSGGDKQYLSCLYAGMANHYLLNLTAENTSSDGTIYFAEAYTYYEQAVEFPSRDKKYIYGYLSQICSWAEQYSATYQKSLPLEPTAYKNFADEYRRLSA